MSSLYEDILQCLGGGYSCINYDLALKADVPNNKDKTIASNLEGDEDAKPMIKLGEECTICPEGRANTYCSGVVCPKRASRVCGQQTNAYPTCGC